MSSEIASLYAKIGADTSGLKRGLDETKSGLQATKGNITDMLTTMAKVTGVATAAGLAIKAALDFGEEGAQLRYTEERFDRLAESVGSTANALNTKLRGATRRTMSDMQLAAAAGDLMALGLANSEAEVVRLTKVAGGLGMNMNQLVLTLTNKTTMRFDQLGVRVDGFKEKVEALKAAGMDADAAFKEAFLQQAEQQLAKVGNKADSAVGSFARLDAATANLSDGMKKNLAPGLASVAEWLAKMITGTAAVSDIAAQTSAAAASYEEYTRAVREAAYAQNAFIDQQGNVRNSSNQIIGTTKMMTESQWKWVNGVGQLTDYEDTFIEKINRANAAQAEAESHAGRNYALSVSQVRMMGSLSFAESARAFSVEETTRRMDELQLFMAGPVKKENENYRKQLQDLQRELADTGEKMRKLRQQPWNKKELQETEKQYGDIKQQIVQVEQQHSQSSKQILFDLTRQRLAQDGVLDKKDIDLLMGMGEQWGLIDEETKNLYQNMKFPLDSFQAGELSAQKTLEILERMAGTDWVVSIEFQTNMPAGMGWPTRPTGSDAPRIGGANGGGKQEQKAAGGPVMAGNPYLVGERGPEMFVPNTSGRIVPNNQLAAGQQVTQNITVNLALPQSGYSAQQLFRELRGLGVK